MIVKTKARSIWYRVICTRCGSRYKTMPWLWSVLRGVPPVFRKHECGGRVRRRTRGER